MKSRVACYERFTGLPHSSAPLFGATDILAFRHEYISEERLIWRMNTAKQTGLHLLATGQLACHLAPLEGEQILQQEKCPSYSSDFQDSG